MVMEKISGVYQIKNKLNGKVYIGSSIDCHFRMTVHKNQLILGKHRNKNLQLDFNVNQYEFTILKEVEEENLLVEEKKTTDCIDKNLLYNTWSNKDLKDIKVYLDKINLEDKYIILEDGCWEFTGHIHKEYGRFKVKKKGKTFCFIAHRVYYYRKTDEYPELIRHTCHNKKCVNPEHLIPGSHRQNRLDTTNIFSLEFEEVWLKNLGDKEAIRSHFGWKETKNVTYNEHRLGLVKKHLDLLIQYSKSINVIKDPRGRKRKDMTGQIFNGWICIVSHIHEKSHIWENLTTKELRISTASNISKVKPR